MASDNKGGQRMKVRARAVLTLQQPGDFAPGILLFSAALGQERSTDPHSLGRVSSLRGSALKAAFSNGKEHKVGPLCGTIQRTLTGHTHAHLDTQRGESR